MSFGPRHVCVEPAVRFMVRIFKLIALLSVSIMICSVLATLLAVGELTINVRLKSASTPLPRSQHVISKPVGSSPTLPPAARQNASVSRAGTESNSGASGQHQAGGKEKRQNRGKKQRSERAGAGQGRRAWRGCTRFRRTRVETDDSGLRSDWCSHCRRSTARGSRE